MANEPSSSAHFPGVLLLMQVTSIHSSNLQAVLYSSFLPVLAQQTDSPLLEDHFSSRAEYISAAAKHWGNHSCPAPAETRSTVKHVLHESDTTEPGTKSRSWIIYGTRLSQCLVQLLEERFAVFLRRFYFFLLKQFTYFLESLPLESLSEKGFKLQKGKQTTSK